jgi:hypothetical protein
VGIPARPLTDIGNGICRTASPARENHSGVGPEQRGGPVLAAAVHGDMLVGLDSTERVEQLPDQHGETGGRGHEQMHGADVTVLAARRAHAVLDGKRNIRRLAGRPDDMRIGARPRDVNERPERRQFLESGGEYRFGVVGDGDEHREVAGGRLLAGDLGLESGVLLRLRQRPDLIVAPRRDLAP